MKVEKEHEVNTDEKFIDIELSKSAKCIRFFQKLGSLIIGIAITLFLIWFCLFNSWCNTFVIIHLSIISLSCLASCGLPISKTMELVKEIK